MIYMPMHSQTPPRQTSIPVSVINNSNNIDSEPLKLAIVSAALLTLVTSMITAWIIDANTKIIASLPCVL